MMKNNSIKFFDFSLALVFITLPAPKYSLNSLAIILLVISWLFVGSFSQKIEAFKEQKNSILIFSLIIITLLFGLLYTENFNEGLSQIKDKAPLILLPVVLLTTNSIKRGQEYYYFKLFAISTIVWGVFAIVKALILSYTGMGNYFVYSEFAILLNKHTTYYSLFCVISVNYLIYDLLYIKKTSRIAIFFSILFLLLVIYMLSSRMAILCLLLIAIFYIKQYFTKNNQQIFLVTLVLSATLATLFFSSNYVSRFESIYSKNNKITEVNTRLIHWTSAFETLDNKSIILGKGTGDGKNNLFKQYKLNKFEAGFKNKYNAHNQYIEFTLSNGLLGLVSYMAFLFLPLIYAIRMNDFFGILCILILALCSITESILERQSGILITSLIVSFVYSHNKNKLSENLSLKRE